MSTEFASVLRPLSASALLLLLCACSTTSTAPVASSLPGSWTLDRAASDDAGAKVTRAIQLAEQKIRARRRAFGLDAGAGGGGGPGVGGPSTGGPGGGGNGGPPPGDTPAPAGGAGTGPPDEAPDESYDIPTDPYGGPGRLGPDFRDLRLRLMQALQAPKTLQIEVSPDSVRIAPGDIPARDYRTDEQFTRLDEYGTSKIDARWSGTAFILRARYSAGGQRQERYDAASGTMTLTTDFTDPIVGKIEVRSTYRHP